MLRTIHKIRTNQAVDHYATSKYASVSLTAFFWRYLRTKNWALKIFNYPLGFLWILNAKVTVLNLSPLDNFDSFIFCKYPLRLWPWYLPSWPLRTEPCDHMIEFSDRGRTRVMFLDNWAYHWLIQTGPWYLFVNLPIFNFRVIQKQVSITIAYDL